MNRRDFLRQAAVGGAASCYRAPAKAPERRPNILLLLADQWRGQTLPPAGDRDLKAPHLSRLAGEGLTFRRAYASSPLCSPSRASILTGRFPHACGVTRNNLRLPEDEPSLAAELLRAGYATGYIGKWHLDGEGKPGFVPPGPRRHGYDYWAAFNRGHSYYRSTYYLDDATPIQPKGFEPDYQTSLAVDFIRRNRTGPFFLVVSWGPPHPPRTPPPAFAKLYKPGQFSLRANVPATLTRDIQRDYANYYALCSALDDNVGRLLGCLEEEGIAAGTLVVFTSDHGDMLGSHGLAGKNEPYEESVLIPLLMRYPRTISPGTTLEMPVSNVDLMPTLLSIAGAPVPQGVQGRDFSGLVLTGKGQPSESIYCQGRLGTAKEWRMVVRGLDKIVVDRNLETTHLFNLGRDPYEMENLADEKVFRRKRDEMHAILRDWMRRMGDRILPSGLKLRD